MGVYLRIALLMLAVLWLTMVGCGTGPMDEGVGSVGALPDIAPVGESAAVSEEVVRAEGAVARMEGPDGDLLEEKPWLAGVLGEGPGSGGMGSASRPSFGSGSVWPTLTPVPPLDVGNLAPVVDSGSEERVDETPVVEEVEVVWFTCEVDFKKWLFEEPWRDARDLELGMKDFRELRPDCNEVVFAPEFSARSLCRDDDRVGGIRVGSWFSMGRSHNYNLALRETKRAPGSDMLIHFRRLPEQRNGGCWYYVQLTDTWYETAVDGSGRVVVVTVEPTQEPVVAEFRLCDDALRRRLNNEVAPLLWPDMQVIIGDVSTGLSECAFGWNPEVSEGPVAQVCPRVGSHRTANGDILMHWSGKPGDGASCWMYDSQSGEWEAR